MKSVITLAKKELLISRRYRFLWLNFFLTPFFVIAPWIFTTNIFSRDFSYSVLVASMIWYWLNHFFFGAQDTFVEEREEGTLISIVASPIGLTAFLFGKSLWYLIECIYITITTLTIFYLIGFKISNLLLIFTLIVGLGFHMFLFSIMWAGLVLLFRSISSINTVVQQGLASISGVTADTSSYPTYARILASFIPLTYAINIARKLIFGHSEILFDLILLNAISLMYFVLGYLCIRYAEKKLRIEDGWESW